MRRLSAIFSGVARRVGAAAFRALRFVGAAYVASLNIPGIYLAVGSRGTRYAAKHARQYASAGTSIAAIYAATPITIRHYKAR